MECFISVINLSYITWRLKVQNLRLPIADPASFVQCKCFYDYKESLSVPLMTITLISSGNIVSIRITFKKALVNYCCKGTLSFIWDNIGKCILCLPDCWLCTACWYFLERLVPSLHFPQLLKKWSQNLRMKDMKVVLVILYGKVPIPWGHNSCMSVMHLKICWKKWISGNKKPTLQ